MNLLNQFRNYRLRHTFGEMRSRFYRDLGEAMVDQKNLSSSSWSLLTQISDWSTRYALRGDSRAEVLSLIAVRMRMKAMSFPQALQDLAPTLDVMALKASEMEGELGEGLVSLAIAVEEAEEMRSTVRSLLMQPAFLAFMTIIIICGFSYGLVPVLIQLMPPEKLPTSGYIMYVISTFVTNYGLFIGAVLIALIAWVIWSLDNFTGRWRDKIENWPFYSIYRDYNSARFLQSLASLMHAGVSLRNSLAQISPNASPWLNSHILRIIHRLDNANTPEDAFATGLLDIEIEDRLRDYSKRSDFPAAIENLGKKSARFVLEKIKESAKAIVAISKFVMTIVICFTFTALVHSAVQSASAMQSNYTQSK